MRYLYICLFLFCFIFDIGSVKSDDLLISSIKNEKRNEKNIKRDKYRNPLETLSFFEINREKKILEISPGGGYYSEIISYYMKETNNFFSTEYLVPPVEAVRKGQENYNKFFEENKGDFGQIKKIYLLKNNKLELKEKDFDLVLTFRNTHNWLGSKTAKSVYQSIYNVMKKGGVLGIVQHKADENSKLNFKNGYVKESFIIRFLEDIGFKLLDKSDINKNTKDKKDYKNGVWTLPPRLVLGDIDRQKYLDIGESDRMTLKFIK